MPKHQGPVQQLIDPFSVPAQMNNLGVFIVAFVTKSVHQSDFLNFIYYGSAIVSAGTALITIMYMIGLLDYCINKVMPCGEVCLTLNTLTIFFAGLIYHIVATVYGIVELFWGEDNACVELVMFKKITGWIYVSWFFFILAYVIGKWLWVSRKKEIRTVQENYTELK